MTTQNSLGHMFGPHVSVKDIPNLYDKGLRVFQIMLGSPRTLSYPSDDTKARLLDMPDDVNIIVHGPYTINLLNSSHKIWQPTMVHAAKTLELCAGLGVSSYLTHLGALDSTQTREDGFRDALHFLEKLSGMTEGIPTNFLLENDCGSKSGTKCANVPFIYNLVKKFDNPKVKMALDTEHAFAHGFDISNIDLMTRALIQTKLIHLNAIPDEVAFGQHLDRHSTTQIEDSREADSIVNIVKLAVSLAIPMVFERESVEYFAKDMKYLQPRLR